MKIAIAASGKELESLVDAHFGRCPYFLIADEQGQTLAVVENTAREAFRGAGISAAQLVVDQKVQAVIAGNFGPNAVNVLRTSGVKIFAAPVGLKVGEAVQAYQKGELTEITSAAGFSFGRGRGGRWRGRQ